MAQPVQFQVEIATEIQSKARVALAGTAGSGKTYSALQTAAGLASSIEKVLVVDTENGSSAKYAKDFGPFRVIKLKDDFSPQRYIDAIIYGETNGFEVIILDSLSHAWEGQGGALELVDQEVARTQSRNSFAAWRKVTPLHNKLVGKMLTSDSHVIATLRTKTEYSVENEGGKSSVRKLGMKPIQREGMDYEFDLVIDMAGAGASMVVSKSRCKPLSNGVFDTNSLAGAIDTLKGWLETGEAVEDKRRSKQDLYDAARVMYDMSPTDVGKAVLAAGLSFDPDNWQGMLDALESYHSAPAQVLDEAATEVAIETEAPAEVEAVA